MSTGRLALKARCVFPVCGPPLANGFVTIDAGRIVSVSGERPDCPLVDLGNAAILPALVNAHTHLEFSANAAPLGAPGTSLPTWIRQVVAQRRGTPQNDSRAISTGLGECLAAGTGTLGEIATTDWRSRGDLPADIPHTVLFWESLGVTDEAVARAISAAVAFVDRSVGHPRVLPALSPHAPYSTHPRLVAALVDLAVQHGLPVAMHVAETREELELLAQGTGEFRDMLVAFGQWDANADARLASPLEYLELLARAPRALVIHGNYLNAMEHEFLAARAETMALVYCPRTHAYFRHAPYPLARLIDAGVSLALGTDSRASNPDLSLFDELRFAAAKHPEVPPEKLLEMATTGGADALGVAASAGSLAPGMPADLAIVSLGSREAGDPHHLLFDPAARVTQTWLAGRRIA